MNNVKVSSTITEEQYITSNKIRQHHLIVDEPIEKGGKDTAPTPTELLGVALASCTTITLQMYMGFKEIPFENIDVETDFEVKTIESILFNRSITIEGEFDEKQQTRLLKVANSCPVHKILEKGHQVETKISFK